jgi:hypothetical protein
MAVIIQAENTPAYLAKTIIVTCILVENLWSTAIWSTITRRMPVFQLNDKVKDVDIPAENTSAYHAKTIMVTCLLVKSLWSIAIWSTITTQK